jgi:flagellar biosynthesis/type III secretory pathway protein FliH
MSLKKQIQKNSIQLHGKAIKTANRSYAEGVQAGFREGYAKGVEETIGEIQTAKKQAIEHVRKVEADVKRAMDMFYERVSSLREVPDIGEKRFKAIIEYLGYTLDELSRKEP